MDWVEIAALGVIGALSAGVAMLVQRAHANSVSSGEPKAAAGEPVEQNQKATFTYGRGWPFVVVMMVSFVSLNSLYEKYLEPIHRERQMRSTLATFPFYGVLADKEPAALDDAIQEITRSGQPITSTSVREALSKSVGGVMPKYLATAPDEALVEFFSATVEVLRHRRETSGTACFLTLFPRLASPEERPLIHSSTLQPGLQERILNAMARVVELSPQPLQPNDNQVGEARFAGSILPAMESQFGALLELMDEPERAMGAQRQAVCDITIAMYAAVLQLEAGRASVLRFIMES